MPRLLGPLGVMIVVALGWTAQAEAQANGAETCVVVVVPPAGQPACPPPTAVPQFQYQIVPASSQPAPLEERREPRWAMAIAGLGLFASGYVLTLAIGQSSNGAYPWMGSFLSMGSQHDTLGNTVLFISGIAQIAGTVLGVLGLTLRRRVLAPARQTSQQEVEVTTEVQLTPYVGIGAAGLGASIPY